MKCRHLIDTCAEKVGPTGAAAYTGHLCTWAEAHPDRLLDAPRWISQPALASILIDPAEHCVGCPGYQAAATGRQA
jgi:hypothetical protein